MAELLGIVIRAKEPPLNKAAVSPGTAAKRLGAVRSTPPKTVPVTANPMVESPEATLAAPLPWTLSSRQ